jgi:multicomponent Na+:H+ antiporter subunit C
MELVFALAIGAMFAAGIYMILRRSIVKLLFGLIMLSNAANLMLFTIAGLRRGEPPITPDGASQPPEGASDPLVQALVLTAIVISFGVLAYATVLVKKTYQAMGTDDLDAMGNSPE